MDLVKLIERTGLVDRVVGVDGCSNSQFVGLALGESLLLATASF